MAGFGQVKQEIGDFGGFWCEEEGQLWTGESHDNMMPSCDCIKCLLFKSGTGVYFPFVGWS